MTFPQTSRILLSIEKPIEVGRAKIMKRTNRKTERARIANGHILDNGILDKSKRDSSGYDPNVERESP
jgi:hypothetical protein